MTLRRSGLGLGFGARQAQPGPLHGIRGQGRRPAGVGDERDPVAGRQRLIGKRQRTVEQRLDIPDFDHAGLLACGAKRSMETGQRAGVRRGGSLAARGAART